MSLRNLHFTGLLILLFCFNPFLKAQVVISEVMFDVVGADYHDEFVELFNCADSAVDLSGWQISDSSGADQILDAGQGLILSPGQFAVILDGSYFENSTTYDSVIPPEALILKISDGAFGNNGLSNSTPERVMLLNASGDLVDAYRYTLDNAPGFSDEKINLCAPATADNWANSRRLGGTPGFKNSVEPFDFDLGFTNDGLIVSPQSAVQKGQSLLVTLKYFNAGVRRFESQVIFICYLDLNGNQKLETLEPELFREQRMVNLEPGEQDSLQFNLAMTLSGRLLLSAQLQSLLDQNEDNNTVQSEVTVLESQSPLVINEIKFLTEQEKPEWIELFNKSNESVSLKSWAIADRKDTVKIEENLMLAGKSYFVLTADSSFFDYYGLPENQVLVAKNFPTLNNDQDDVFLLPPWGGWAEQVPYRQDWLMGEEYRKPSLERINPELDARLARNWAPCVNEGTPGAQNSIFSEIRFQKLKLDIEPNPFSPDGDGHEDFAIITLQAPAQTARIRVSIFDILGRRVRTLTENQYIGQQVQIVWDGRNDQKARVRMGIYIVFVQLIDDSNGILEEAKNTVVVAY